MSAPRYCDLAEPHAGHEWTQTVSYPITDSLMPSGAYYNYCWGVKNHPELSALVEIRNRAQRRLLKMNRLLSEAALKHRRSEDEFYQGDYDANGKRLPLEPRKR